MGTLCFHSCLTFCQWHPRSESTNPCDQWCLNMSLVFFILSLTCLAYVLSCQEASQPHQHSAKPELKALLSIAIIFTTICSFHFREGLCTACLVWARVVASACQRQHQPSLKLLLNLIISTGNSPQTNSPAANLCIYRQAECWFIFCVSQSEEKVDNKL